MGNETGIANMPLLPSPFIEKQRQKTPTREPSPVANSSNLNHIPFTSFKSEIIPPHPVKPVMQRGGNVKVNIKMLQCNAIQLREIEEIYSDKNQFCRLFETTDTAQFDARWILEENGLDIRCLEDLGNRWSKRWSKANKSTPGATQRVLLQCQCGSSTVARQEKLNAKKKINGLELSPKKWSRKMPYDFTGCLAHLDITFVLKDFIVQRITGVIEHNEACKSQDMKRFPAVPLHSHVWQVALEQLNEGASLTATQTRNRDLFNLKAYNEQRSSDPRTANVRYNLLPSDLCRLYRKQAAQDGINLTYTPEINVHNWMNPEHYDFKPELAKVVFGYHGRASKSERFKICLHTQEMQDAAWKYAHKGQLLLDGTFGICNSRVLLFIAMAIDEDRKGLPIAFFLFSAPSGNRATHSGYNIEILAELFGLWKTALGKKNDESFCPKVAITDTDTKERGALLTVWPTIFLLLCKFHVRQCWSNKRKALLNMGKKYNFEKVQIETRLRTLEENLIKTITHEKASELIQNEHAVLTGMSQGTGCNPKAVQGLAFLTYLTDTWMPNPLWQGWSQGGRIKASKILDIDVDGVIPTTNHLEAFNGVLKSKYLNQAKHHGRRLRLDLLVFLLAFKVLPEVYKQRNSIRQYYEWLSARFRDRAGGVDIQRAKKILPITSVSTPVAWWTADSESIHQEAAAEIVRLQRIGTYTWLDPYTLSATCAHTAADIRQSNCPHYDLKISGYGWAYCSCPYFLSSKGACKHLWAFRFVLKTQSLPFVITYPCTQVDALKIASYFPLQGKTSMRDPAISIPLPLNSLKKISEEVFTTIQDAVASEGNNDDMDFSDGSLSNAENDYEDLQDIGSRALQQQLQSRLKHELTIILPRLHGLSTLLEEEAKYPVEDDMFDELDGVLC